MIRALSLVAAAALTGCSNVDPHASRGTGQTAVRRTMTVDPLAAGTSLTLDEAAAHIIATGKYETATFALG